MTFKHHAKVNDLSKIPVLYVISRQKQERKSRKHPTVFRW